MPLNIPSELATPAIADVGHSENAESARVLCATAFGVRGK
jgi:hypothetical protein